MSEQSIIVERVYDAPVEKVWKAITDKDEMKQWYFELTEFKPEPGFRFQFTGGPDEGTQYLHLCEIKEVVNEKKLTYSWAYDGYPGFSLVTFELFPQGNKTLLKLTHNGVETFASAGPDFYKSNFVEGWNSIINTSLTNYVEA